MNDLQVYEGLAKGEAKAVPIKFDKLGLDECELLVRAHLYEAFVIAGQCLDTIKRRRLYEERGHASWEAYCDSGECPCKRSHADGLIRAADFRVRLGKPAATAADWTERQIRPFLKIQPPSQGIRLAKKAMSLASKNGGQLTSKICKEVIDAHTGAMPKEKKKRAKALAMADTPGQVLRYAIDQILEIEEILEAFTASAWNDAEADSPGCAERLAQACSDLAEFLRS